MSRIAAVIIGRNEGARFRACLEALPGQLSPVIYVDSGSTDGSVEVAQTHGAEVVALDMSQPFTAARARNAGLKRLNGTQVEYVQLLDGDCALREGWVMRAQDALDADPKLAVVCGRRRERHPGSSLYNLICDMEWDTPVGPASACGGDAMMRLSALQEVGLYRDDLIAGEEPELCVRLRQAGWRIERLDAEMTWHDAAMTRFGQWWQRTRRAGHAFAEGAALHGAPPERHWVRETRRALVWGAGLPVVILLGALVWPWALLLALAYPAQVIRLALRDGGPRPWARAMLSVLGKFAEAQGALGYYVGRWRGQRRGIIEYK
ncbi:glycosyltransferase [Roseovarius faecimaris]|uniref:Glycosyltransferase n=1 Tax=Roseovarius faecimaris TaxID=2494550 RepID=A0A6I6ITI6_9RHOB|nr:glycosyltransferase [Roseovarius faecimaris]QGX99512.1 glycosyltransferase [Roseovarius faecimaris]